MATAVAPARGTEDRGSALIIIFWTECALALVVVLLRLHSRLLIRGLGKDDVVMFFTMLLLLILTIFVTVLARNGGAKHLYDLDSQQIQTVVKLNWELQPFGIMALGTSKISVAFLLLRIFGPNTVWRRWFLYVTMVITFLVNALACIISFVQCNPPRALWETVPGARCWDPSSQANYSTFSSSWNAAMDFCLALLPITTIYNLELSAKKKTGLCSLLGLGILAKINSHNGNSTRVTCNDSTNTSQDSHSTERFDLNNINIRHTVEVTGEAPGFGPLASRPTHQIANAENKV
ncbi:MAG: hypothetical protein Q9187_004601 [Circinaria calcarea]